MNYRTFAKNIISKIGPSYRMVNNTRMQIEDMEDRLQEKYKSTLKIAFVLLILLKLILVMGHKIYAIPIEFPHDDSLMYSRAISIINGKWLGVYNNVILAKGAFFSLWLAVLHVLSVPMLIGNQILYIVACLFFVWCIHAIVLNRKILFLIFTALLFNPATLANIHLLRIIRDGIFHSLVLLVFSGLIGMFLNRAENKKMLICSIFSGIGLSAAWHTREDTFWVLPFVIAAAVITAAFLVTEKNCKNRLRKSVYLILPFVFLIISNLLISSINFFIYGRFIVNDYMSKDFQGAYGALTRVTHEEFNFDIPVPQETRMKIYQASPAFNELRPFLDEGPLEYWKFYRGKIHDFYGGWFFWALRDAVAFCGYYENPQKAKAYYEKLAKEVNDACDNGLLPSRTAKRATLASPFSREYITPTIKYIIDATLLVIRYDSLNPHLDPSQVSSPHLMAEYRKSEIFLNGLAAYVDRGKGGIFLSGWVFDESENIAIHVMDSLNQEVGTTIIKSDSPDVYNHFYGIYETALRSRFSIEFEADENLDYYLYFSNETGEQVSILINDMNGNSSNVSTIRYNIDNVNIGNSMWDASIYNTRADRLKLRITNFVIKIYRLINPAATLLAFLSLLVMTVLIFYRLFKKMEIFLYGEVIILWGLLLSFMVRNVMVAYVSASSFHAVNILYLSSSYPIVIMFNCISMCCIYNLAKRYLKKELWQTQGIMYNDES